MIVRLGSARIVVKLDENNGGERELINKYGRLLRQGLQSPTVISATSIPAGDKFTETVHDVIIMPYKLDGQQSNIPAKDLAVFILGDNRVAISNDASLVEQAKSAQVERLWETGDSTPTTIEHSISLGGLVALWPRKEMDGVNGTEPVDA